LWIVRFPTAFILSQKTALAYEGIWWSFPISNGIAALIAFIYYKTGHWKVRTIRHRGDWIQPGVG